MLDSYSPPYSAADVVAFVLGLLALILALHGWRYRVPGLLWFAAGSAGSSLAAALNPWLVPLDTSHPAALLLPLYAVRICSALGFVHFLCLPAGRRLRTVALLMLPMLCMAVAMLSGIPVGGSLSVLPLLYADAGLALLCVMAARQPGGGTYALLAGGVLCGPAAWLLAATRGTEPLLLQDHYAWPGAIGLGVMLLGACLLHKSQESERIQALTQRKSSFFAALSETNQAILRMRDPMALYAEICRICVATGHAQMACVYLAEGTPASSLRRVASAGPADEFLEGFPNPWDISTPQAQGSYTVRALREGEPIVSNDYQRDPLTRPWQERAQRHQVQAIAWLPLKRNAMTVGVLMLTAREIGFFDTPLLTLLSALAADISFALDNHDREIERVEASRQVQAGLERFMQLFQAAPVASCIVSLDARIIVEVNQAMCERMRMERADLIGRTTASLPRALVSEDREKFYAELRASGRIRNLVVRAHDAAGGQHVELLNAELIDYLGERCHLVMSLDITDLRAAEEAREALSKAQAASRAKTDFLSHMSHELRTPLNAVLGFSGLLQRGAADRLTPKELAYLDHVQKAGWHLLRLINDVLDLSLIEAGRVGIDAGPIELALLLDEVLTMTAPMAQDRQVTLHAGYGHDPGVWVLADGTRLRQVVVNVVSNAIKYNRVGGTVHVGVHRRGGKVSVEVLDTGVGMSGAQLLSLFEPFNRLGREREGYEGTGVGLALAQLLMRLMDGDIEVESEVGRGTLMRLTLPQASAVPEGMSTTAHAALDAMASAAAGLHGTILYIEDNALNALLVEQLVAHWPGVQLRVAVTGRAGLALALQLRPDLVLLDLDLPDLQGLDVLRQLKAAPELKDTAVVVVSASAMPEDVALGRRAGAADYWTKPLDVRRFQLNVARFLPRSTNRPDQAAP